MGIIYQSNSTKEKMKTVFNSNPEFSLTFNHCGVSVTLSAKVLTEDYLGIEATAQANEERLGRVSLSSLPQAALQAGQLIEQYHSEFSSLLARQHSADLSENPLDPRIDPDLSCSSHNPKNK
ncbi:hypothetical protein [Nitrosomonas aestuarii]|uniref:hypothetical protein n=1 Tax=Nitrosomonas aestuarii TaxID=52441 RepID=UPI00147E52B6|nr:hypothetical protein [Nitrosomonas aestuarii]